MLDAFPPAERGKGLSVFSFSFSFSFSIVAGVGYIATRMLMPSGKQEGIEQGPAFGGAVLAQLMVACCDTFCAIISCTSTTGGLK